MSTFHRRLPKKSNCALEQLSCKRAGWWPDLLSYWAPSGSSGNLRLAIRNNYMNFYSNGQSIAKITFGPGGASPTMRIHEKYVKEDFDGGQKYIKLTDKEGRDSDGRSVKWGGPEMLDSWIHNAFKYGGEEKRHIESLLQHSPKVIDLEMGLPAFDDRKSALRMDLVSLEGKSNGIRLVFWEAKMIGNSALKSRINQPRVFEQIEAYRSYLADVTRKKQVEDAYKECCRIICDIHKMASKLGLSHPLDPLVVAAANCDSLDVEETPRLVIFEDGKKRDENAWQKHLKVLLSKVSVTIVDKSSPGLPLEAIPRSGE